MTVTCGTVLSYGNKYIENREYIRYTRTIDDKAMLNKVVSYLSECEESMKKKNLPIPGDWYEGIRWASRRKGE